MVANYSRNKQFITFLLVLKDYNIIQKLRSIVCNNATLNNILCYIVEAYLREEEDIKWDSIYRRIRCTGYIINLAVQAFLFHGLIKKEQLELYDE